MTDQLKYKSILIFSLILVALYVLAPTFFEFKNQLGEEAEKNKFASYFPDKALNLGLDLRGGMYLEMDVDLKEALKNRLNVLLIEIERSAESKQIKNVKLIAQDENNQILVSLPQDQETLFKNLIADYFNDVFTRNEGTQIIQENNAPYLKYSLSLKEDYLAHLKETTLKQAVEAVRNRVDRYGVSEAVIQRQGESRVIIEIPGISEPDRVIEIIRKTGLLEFKLVDTSKTAEELAQLIAQARSDNKISEGFSKESVAQINKALKDKIPEGSEIAFELQRDTTTKEIINGVPYLLFKRVDVSGDMLQNAQVGVYNNEPHVSLSFNKLGAKNFGELTKKNIGKPLAILLDGVVSTAPVIQTAILTGDAQISLGYGGYQQLLKEAEDLSLLLREGALPASLTIATKTVIGPSLGLDSIRKGLNSLYIATLVIVVFMIVYYKWGGVVSTLALTLNVLFLFAILALFQASLTLPGIAGIVLTIGMAVDANIIIFERMKEEKQLGKTPKTIVESGYGNAMSAIIDSNLTTLIAGIILYQFGTGPVKGFATTLMIGILTTLFSAVIVTRFIYDYFIFKRKITKVSI